jgi:hypothetical protein
MRKKLFTFYLLILLSVNLFAQAPEGVSYQAVARNSGGSPLVNQNISVLFTIRTLISGGTILYRETHNVTTNSLGLFNVNVGQGTPVLGTFSAIAWNSGTKFLQVEMDPAGGSSFVNMGTQQLMSVPYSLYAKSAGNVWNLSGNGGITSGQFLGTTDLQPLRLRVGNIPSGLIDAVEFNTAFGYSSLASSSGSGYNTTIGYLSQNATTTGGNNSVVGAYALSENTTGSSNTAIGFRALQTNLGGSSSTAIGSSAMRYANNTSSNISLSNTAVGAEALRGSTSPALNTGKFNTAVGVQALTANTSGEMNSSYGVASLISNTTGSSNTVMGYGAFPNNVGGSSNTVIGAMTNQGITGGTLNTLIGYGAQTILSNLTNATAIGANASVLTSNSLVLGENANVGIGCNAPQYKLHVIGDIASSATIRTTNALVTGAISACSDARFKKDITPLRHSLEKIIKLNGVSYYWKKEEFKERNFTDERQIGVIAQEIEKIYPELVKTDNDGYKSVDYSRLTPVLIEAIKELKKENDEMKNRLQREIDDIKAEMGMVKASR